MIFDTRQVHLYHIGFAACALLGLAVITLLLPKGRRLKFVEGLARGWLSGLCAGAILVALFYIPWVGWFLIAGLDKLLPFGWKIGMRLPPFETIIVVFSTIGIAVGFIIGISANLLSRGEEETKSSQPPP